MASSFDNLPTELLYDVLQRLPAKVLCRLRAVCRSWRAITSDAAFISAHAGRHRETLFLAKFRDDDRHVYVVDLSGDVVKRIPGADGGHHVLRTRLNLAVLATDDDRYCRLLNPATGRIQVLPPISVVEHVNDLFLRNRSVFFALGFVASAGQYKLLRCWRPIDLGIANQLQVLTINGGTATDWRTRPCPRCFFHMQGGIVVDGVVYFLKVPPYYDIVVRGRGTNDDAADSILSFDLATEEWRRDLHGPLRANNVPHEEYLFGQVTLADLRGPLVLSHCRHHLSKLDLWFLQDFESGLWAKEYSIQIGSLTSGLANMLHGFVLHLVPLLALHDGRLVIYVAPVGILFICDPGTNTFTRVQMRHRLDSVGLYTGSLMSLQ